jgi:hypothetical protein
VDPAFLRIRHPGLDPFANQLPLESGMFRRAYRAEQMGRRAFLGARAGRNAEQSGGQAILLDVPT